MRPLIVACVLMLAGCGTVRAQTPPPQPNPMIDIKLPSATWNTVLQGLAELPLKTALPIVQDILNQAAPQMKPPETKK